MSYKEFNPNTSLGYEEFYVSVKVKTVGGYLGDMTSKNLKDDYDRLVSYGELNAKISEYLTSILVGEHQLGTETCEGLGLIDKLIIEVED